MDNRPEEQQDYYKKIQHLLSHYEAGWDVFINAHKAQDYDYPLIRKPEFKDDPYLPQTWLELVAEVQGIIAKDKFELDYYTPHIEIIRADHMLDVYTTVGLPNSYKHWTFGKRRMIEERKYDASKHLSYEIVINSEPCIAYCMDTNSPVMQMLVIAHACYGHNAVFKNNYLFKEFTNADTILSDMKNMRDFVFECEEKYGWKEVSDFLDFCHAMQFMDVPDTKAQKTLSRHEMEKRAKEKRMARFEQATKTKVFNNNSEENDNARDKQSSSSFPYRGEKNILCYMADHDGRFPEWKQTIMRMRSELSQYFKPQMMTKMLNEGFATFTHMKILETMVDIGLMDYGMSMEFHSTNDAVIYQPSAIRKMKDEDGVIHDVFVGASMNPYALGLAMFQDIERICMNPTEEDKQWFKHFAGNGDWLSMVKHAMESSSDETFVEQYLSPTVMRKFAFFDLEDRAKSDFYWVAAIHDEDGFRQIRSQLASDYRISDLIPDVRVYNYQDADRCLILRHQMRNGAPLDPATLQPILQHIHYQRGFPVVIESVDENDKVVATYSSPPKYDFKKFKKVPYNKGLLP